MYSRCIHQASVFLTLTPGTLIAAQLSAISCLWWAIVMECGKDCPHIIQFFYHHMLNKLWKPQLFNNDLFTVRLTLTPQTNARRLCGIFGGLLF
jgi:hypothetical protein